MVIQAIGIGTVHAEPTRDRRTRLPELLGLRLARVPHVALLGEGAAPAHVVDADLGRLGHVDLLRRLRRVSIDTAFSCARRAVPVNCLVRFGATRKKTVGDGVELVQYSRHRRDPHSRRRPRRRALHLGLARTTGRRPLVDVRIHIFLSRNFYYALSTHWHIGISCFLPRGIVIQLSVCSNICLPFVTALRPDRPTPSPSGWPNACGWASGGLPPALPALGPSAAPAAAAASTSIHELASTGLVACAKYVSGAVQGRSSTAHRGLERNSFLLLVSYRTLAPCFGQTLRAPERQQDVLSRLFNAPPTVT